MGKGQRANIDKLAWEQLECGEIEIKRKTMNIQIEVDDRDNKVRQSFFLLGVGVT